MLEIIKKFPLPPLNTIKIKLTVACAILLGMVSCFIYLYFPARQEKQAIKAIEAKAQSISAMTAFSVAPALYFNDKTDMMEIIESTRQNKDLYFILIQNSAGVTVAGYAHPDVTAPADSNLRSPGNKNDLLQLESPVFLNNKKIGNLILGLSLHSIKLEIKKSRQTIAILSAFIFIFGLVAIYFLVSIFTRPLTHIVHSTQQIAAGDFNSRAKVYSDDEIGRLALAFNKMVDQLQKLYSDLETTNKNLEQRVTLRTRELQKEVDERKRLHIKLLESERRYRHLVNDAHDMIQSIDKNGRIIFVNNSWSKELGYAEDDVLNLSFFDIIHPDHYDYCLEKFRANTRGERCVGIETCWITKEGTKIWVEGNVSPLIKDNEVQEIQGIYRNITDRKQHEEALKASLHEKEILLKEIHHRVKNNMQIISSLLNLQAEDIKDTAVIHAFEESKNRIRSMALVHEKLYQSKDFAKIELSDYVNSLIRNLYFSCRSSEDDVQIDFKADRLYIDIDLAVPLGLIMNELITNALKHAFPSHFQGQKKMWVSIKVSKTNRINIIVKDNGVGIPLGAQKDVRESLGLKLVYSLVEDQLEGKLDLVNGEGTKFKISLPQVHQLRTVSDSKDA
jgi:PAS domain S-box-containing protein